MLKTVFCFQYGFELLLNEKDCLLSSLLEKVGAGGFEPPTSRTRTVRATGLRYAPNVKIIPYLGIISQYPKRN